MPMRAFAPRLRFLLLHKQGDGLSTGLHPQALLDVLDALAGKAELSVRMTSPGLGLSVPRLAIDQQTCS